MSINNQKLQISSIKQSLLTPQQSLQIIDKYKDYKNQLIDSHKKISSTIKNETQQEVANIKQSINNYNNKVKQILERDDIKGEQQNMKVIEKKMNVSLFEAEKLFIQGSNQIDNRTHININQKQQMKKLLFDKILSRLDMYNDIKQFERMFGNSILIIPRGQNNLLGI